MMTIRCLLIVVAATLLGCQTTKYTVQPLKVGITSNPPLVFWDTNDDVVGLEADFARALAKELGRPVKFVSCYPDFLLPSLRRGEIDIIMSGLPITDERKMVVSFAAPYLESGQVAIFHKDDASKYTDFRQVLVTRDRVGVADNSGAASFRKQVMYRGKSVPCASVEVAVDELLARKVGLVLCDSPAAMWQVAQRKNTSLAMLPQLLTCEQLAWAVRRDDKALLDAANKMLAAWKKDGRLKAALQRWAPNHDTLKQAVIK